MSQFDRRMQIAKLVFRARKLPCKGVGYKYLAGRFNVTVRTIKTDILALEDYFSFKHNDTGAWYSTEEEKNEKEAVC